MIVIVRKDLIRETSLRTGYTQNVCSEIIRDMFAVITTELESHGSVKIPNFGVFDVYDKKPTNVKMPSGEMMKIEQKKYPRFLPSDMLKEKVNN